jgi:toxin ParE1/3/4
VSVPAKVWPVHLTAAAESDFEQAVLWSVGQFGMNQARIYAETLALAVAALAEGPAARGVKHREDIGKRLMSLHVARLGRKGRHFVIFRTRRRAGKDVVEVLRLLHDSMDLARHLPPVGGTLDSLQGIARGAKTTGYRDRD